MGELAALQLIVLFLPSPCACSARRASTLHWTLWLNSRILLLLCTGFANFASVHVSTTARAYNIFADFPMVFTISARDDPVGRISGFTDALALFAPFACLRQYSFGAAFAWQCRTATQVQPPVRTNCPCRLRSSPWHSVPACVAIACRIAMFTGCAAANTQLIGTASYRPCSCTALAIALAVASWAYIAV